VNREYHKWFSPVMDREMELLVFGHAGPRLLVFPSRKRRFFEYEDHGMIHALRHRLEAGELQIICVDGIDDQSLYCFDIEPAERIARHLQFERYIIEEVLAFSAKTNPRTPLTAHGCSFGAYHAVAIALRHPRHFKRAVGFSGRYDLTLEVGDFHSLFHGFYDESLASIMPSDFLPKVKDPRSLRQMRRLRITLAIGEEDPFYENNAALTRALAAKRIPHDFHVWCDDAHRFRYWRQMARIYL